MDSNKEWLKKARAKRIAKIQRRRRIDNYIRGRVYMIIIAFLITLGVLYITLGKIDSQQDDMSTLHATMGELLTKTANDKLLKQNLRLVEAIDSLQILIFAYNRRHQADGKTIEALLAGNKPKSIHNKPEFPDYVDTNSYDFVFDTITGTLDKEHNINLNLNKDEENVINDSNSISLLDSVRSK